MRCLINKILLSVLVLIVPFNSTMKAQNVVSPTQTGKIYLLRSTGFTGSAISFKTFIDGNLVCKLSNKKYSIHEVSIGKHDVFVQFEGKKLLLSTKKYEVQVKPDKITYVQFYDLKFFTHEISTKEINQNEAEKIMIDLKEDTKCL